jgi:negative regulator of replication initiation
VAQAKQQGIALPNTLWRQTYEAVDGARVIDFIWESTAISDQQTRADRRRLIRELRKSDQVREAHIVIRRFLGDLRTLHEGRWDLSDIANVQRELRLQACNVYPCKSADE